ncbi:thiamine pyrophosphate-dependent enzyme [Phytohabitans suffuscus]
MAALDRVDVLRQIDAAFPESPVILTLGGTAREMLAVAGRRPNHLVNLDAMGQTVGIGLGIALGRAEGRPDEKVVVVEGDGSLLMGLSVLSTIGHLRPANLVVLILDNGVYLATGGQPTAAADMDMPAVALACGWAAAWTVTTADELTAALVRTAATLGPVLVRIMISTRQIPTSFFLEDPVILAEDFRRWLRALPHGHAATDQQPGHAGPDGPRDRSPADAE